MKPRSLCTCTIEAIVKCYSQFYIHKKIKIITTYM